jgi:hypothetical protein
VWNLSSPNEKEVEEHLNLALKPRRGAKPPATAEEKKEILGLYTQFKDRQGRPTDAFLAAGMREELLQLLHSAYRHIQDGAKLGRVRSEIKSLATQCPYCGFGETTDLDHHLVRNTYRVFSIFVLNLIPSCAQCNRHKPKAPVAQPNRHGINAYLEDLAALDFFETDVEIAADTGALLVTFGVRHCHGMSLELCDRLKNHLQVFKLQARLETQSNLFLGGLIEAFRQSHGAGGGDAVAEFLRQTASSCAERYGANDWRHALLRGLSGCREFCEGGFERALGFA